MAQKLRARVTALVLAAAVLLAGSLVFLMQPILPIVGQVDVDGGPSGNRTRPSADHSRERRQVPAAQVEGLIVLSHPLPGTAKCSITGPGVGEVSEVSLELREVATPFAIDLHHSATNLVITVACGDEKFAHSDARPASKADSDWSVGSIVMGNAGRLHLEVDTGRLPQRLISILEGSMLTANVHPVDGLAGFGSADAPAHFTFKLGQKLMGGEVVRHCLWTRSPGLHSVLWTLRPPLARLPHTLTRHQAMALRADLPPHTAGLSLSAEQFVYGIVRNKDGDGVPGVVVKSGHVEGHQQQLRTDSQGGFVFTCSAGALGTAVIRSGEVHAERSWRAGDYIEFTIETESLARLRILTPNGQPLDEYGLSSTNVQTRDWHTGEIREQSYRTRVLPRPDGVAVVGRDRVKKGDRLFVLHPIIGESMVTLESDLIGRVEPYQVVLPAQSNAQDLTIVHDWEHDGNLSLKLSEVSDAPDGQRMAYTLVIPCSQKKWVAKNIHVGRYSYVCLLGGSVVAEGDLLMIPGVISVLHM